MAHIKKIWFSDGRILVEFNDERVIGLPVKWFPNLSKGSPEQLKNFEIWGDNQYIHWPDLDEDISAEGLISLSIHGLPEGTFPHAS